MYADKSTIGYNLMDLKHSDLVLVRDALELALKSQNLDAEKRGAITVMLGHIRTVCVLHKEDFQGKSV